MRRSPPTHRSAGAQTRGPIWNGRIVAAISAAVALVVACVVFLVGRDSVYDKLGTTVAIIALALLAFLWYGLYSGATLFGEPVASGIRTLDIASGDVGTRLPDIDFRAGVSGMIASFMQWMLMTILLLVLITFVATILWSTLLFLVFVMYWLFFRAMRLVFLKSSVCRGNLILSFQYASFYAVLYTGWIFALVYVSEQLARR